jgi:Mg2+ and Co2+ transporter CorA
MPSHADFLKELLDRLVEGGVPIDAAEKYTERFRGEYLVSLDDVATLTEDHHRELGVAIGHRNILRRCTNELSMSQKLMNSIEWVSLTGKHRTLRSFLEEISCVRKSLELPEAFDRLFQDNRPMPFVETIDDSDAFGLLLRVPDIVGNLGASVNTITNRVCIMVNDERNAVVTYHRCNHNIFEDLRREWDVELRHHHGGMERFFEVVTKCIVRSFHGAIGILQGEMDALETLDSEVFFRENHIDDTARVRRLSEIAKKSGVYKRCSDANIEALEELGDTIPWISPSVKAARNGFISVSSMNEELASNALALIDTIIAMSEFSSSRNLRVFTWLSIFFQPITVATSWYGMNWRVMPELESPNGYFIFTLLAMSSAFFFLLWLFIGDRVISSFVRLSRHLCSRAPQRALEHVEVNDDIGVEMSWHTEQHSLPYSPLLSSSIKRYGGV